MILPISILYITSFSIIKRKLESYLILGPKVDFFSSHEDNYIMPDNLGDHMEPQRNSTSSFSPKHAPNRTWFPKARKRPWRKTWLTTSWKSTTAISPPTSSKPTPYGYAEVSVPEMGLGNTTIRENGETIWENGSYVSGVAGMDYVGENEKYIAFSVGSGSYSFKVNEALRSEVLNATVQNAVNTLSELLIGIKGKFAQP